jgi:hypothetical protein
MQLVLLLPAVSMALLLVPAQDPELTMLMMQQTRARTMGLPKKVGSRQQAAAAGSRQAPGGSILPKPAMQQLSLLSLSNAG